jgi:hypothetical protein
MSGLFLKWRNDTVGIIDSGWRLSFTQPDYNDVVSVYSRDGAEWTPEKTHRFLEERLVSKDRRDIEKILFRLGLSEYDVEKIALITRAIHPKDLLWIAVSENETFDSAITGVFDSVFNRKVDAKGDSLDSPEGFNIKRYGVLNGSYGIYKQRLNPLSTDCESEVAVYLLAKKLGVPCCPAYFANGDAVFSAFRYDFSREYFVHFRRLFSGERSGNEYRNLLSVRPQYKNDIIRMILLDFITRQDDRHLSNMAVKIGSAESFYPLYDNGRSLFYEDSEETAAKAVKDIPAYATSFGPEGSYWDYVREIAAEGVSFGGLINLNIAKDQVAVLLSQSRFSGYRFDAALEWICGAIKTLL